jgi:transcriptional regulator with XRE-family HTH domain
MDGTHLRRLRERTGLTRKEAMRRLGIGRSTLEHYEYGRRRPRPMIAYRMVQVYGCTFDDIYGPYETTNRSDERTA